MADWVSSLDKSSVSVEMACLEVTFCFTDTWLTDLCLFTLHVWGSGDQGGLSGPAPCPWRPGWVWKARAEKTSVRSCDPQFGSQAGEEGWDGGAHTWPPVRGWVPSLEFIVSDLPFLSHLDVLFVFPSKVQSFGERIVLFLLNVVIFGRLERNLDDDDMFFLPHSVKEEAKILWQDGAAVGFYTTKRKGEGCVVEWGHHSFRFAGRLRGPARSEDALSADVPWRESSGARSVTNSAVMKISPRYGFRFHHISRFTGMKICYGPWAPR